MPLIDREHFNQFLTEIDQGTIVPVYLLYGDSYLVNSALAQLTARLIPEPQRHMNLQVVDGSQADFPKILDTLNTFALFSGRKAVAVQDCRVFYSRADLPSLFARSREAHEAGAIEAAARYLLEVLSYAGWSLDDLASGAWRDIPAPLWKQALGLERDDSQLSWLDTVVAHATSTGIEVPERRDDAALLETALRRGLLPDHCLIITTDTVDKRRSLYKLIEDQGVVIDFSVASGSSRQARSEQDTVLKAMAQEILADAGKKIEPDALALLLERTGFNLWALKNQLQKLISFVGPETSICLEHVEDMSHHFREEALYELNNAVTSRDCAASLALLGRLLDQGYHALQLLAALTNEIRRLILARDFIETHLGGKLDPRISYGTFQKTIYPLIKARAGDKYPLSTLHPFALHKTMVRGAVFPTEDLTSSLDHLFAADLALKSTSLPQRAILESLIIRICRGR